MVEVVQEATGCRLETAFADQGYNGDAAAEAAQAHGVELMIVLLPEAKKDFGLLPGAWLLSARSLG